ncbi:MAG: TonB-dependent receptor [Bacteroidetes bacterium]|nr:MAG: TonB-dependent receptor [Bacteroidota bacterium]
MKLVSDLVRKSHRIAKALLCLFLFLPLFAFGQSERFDIDIPEQDLKSALLKVSEVTGYSFSYSESVVPVSNRVKLSVKQATLKEILEKLLPSGIDFLLKEKEVILYKQRPLFDPNKRFTISGYVTEEGSNEALMGVHIYVKSIDGGTVSNAYGYYSLTLASDSQEIHFSYVGYQSRSLKLALVKDTLLSVELNESLNLNEVVISEHREEHITESAQSGRIELNPQDVKSIPALMGEKDVVKVVQQLPGVQSGSEGQSGFFVRGGNSGQNLIILDDAPVYYAFHALGFLSIFNGDAIRSIELNKGSFPARYGGRVASVLDINMKEGHRENFHGELGLGIMTSRVLLEGPIVKKKSSFIFSARRSYIDLLIRPFMSSNQSLDLQFHDLTGKINFDISEKDKLYLSIYSGRDKFGTGFTGENFNEKAGMLSGNTTATLRWNHVVNPKLFVNTAFIFSNFNTNFYDEMQVDDVGYKSDLNSGIRDISLKSDFDLFLNSRNRIRFGSQQIYHYFRPRVLNFESELSEYNRSILETFHSWEGALYVEDEWSKNKWKLNGGLRISYFVTGDNAYLYPEPRLSALYRPRESINLKLGYARMNQYIHQLSNTGLAIFSDLWVPSSDIIRPEYSDQVSFAVEKFWNSKGLSLQTEWYYKHSGRIVGYKEGANFIDALNPTQVQKTRWEENVQSGQGKSYGMEVMLKKSGQKYSGWVSYTWSKSLQQFSSINQGNWIFSPYDRRHNLSFVQVYKASKKFHISATWTYQTGRAVTLPKAEYFAMLHDPSGNYLQSPSSYGNFLPEFSTVNSFRMKDFHRLDISFQFIKKYKRIERLLELNIYNVYANKNPMFYAIESDFTSSDRTVRSFSLFPLPIPMFSYSLKF